jgi:hypothetical protein
MLQTSVQHWRSHQLSKGLFAWKAAYLHAREKKERRETAEGAYKRCLVIMAWKGWACMAAREWLKRQKGAWAVDLHRVQALRKGWQAWREALALGYLKRQREALAGHHRCAIFESSNTTYSDSYPPIVQSSQRGVRSVDCEWCTCQSLPGYYRYKQCYILNMNLGIKKF